MGRAERARRRDHHGDRDGDGESLSTDEIPADAIDEQFVPRHHPRVSFVELDDDGPLLRRWKIRFKPLADLYAKANEPLVLLRELRGLGEVEVELDDGDLPPLNELEYRWTLSNVFSTKSED